MKWPAIQPYLRAALLGAPLWIASGHLPSKSTSRFDWDVYSDTWVAVDGLGRELPTNEQVGPPRQGKTLGMFYFLTFEHSGEGPFDNSKILAEHPEALNDVHNSAWGPLNSSHHWGQPLFDYYASDDPWVLRKHAQMLATAGVDVVVFDNSNVVTYDKARNALCDAWEDIRKHGGKTPQIAFLCPFGNPDGIGSQTLSEIYDTLYEPGLYSDLWFRWEGKPLILADSSYASVEGMTGTSHRPDELTSGATLGQTFTTDRPFTAAGGEFPTWSTTDSGMTLSLYSKGPDGQLLAQKTFDKVRDNATLLVTSDQVLPPGGYYLEMSKPSGHIGWWGYSGHMKSGAFLSGKAVSGERVVHVLY